MRTNRRHILLVEDESAIADTVTYALETEGFEVSWCTTGEQGIRQFEALRPDLVILDIGLPDANGFDVFRRLQRSGPAAVIFLTARSDEIDRVAGLEMGADDYMVKPFSPRELTARARAVLRRLGGSAGTVPDSPFALDVERAQVRYFDQPLGLSRYEYRLLKVLLQAPERVYSREQLLQAAWDHPEHCLDRTVDTHIKTLRAKLRAIRRDRDPIKTRRGLGYYLSPSG
jgi:two-component system catabolic regulation response regulator CreB